MLRLNYLRQDKHKTIDWDTQKLKQVNLMRTRPPALLSITSGRSVWTNSHLNVHIMIHECTLQFNKPFKFYFKKNRLEFEI